MGFLDLLRMNNVFSPNVEEPLFGGLIPRRVERIEKPKKEKTTKIKEIEPRQERTVPQRGLLAKAAPLEEQKGPMNVRFIDTSLEQEAARLARDKFYFERERALRGEDLDEKKFNLESNKFLQSQDEFDTKTGLDKQKLEIDQRAQALNEWKTKNPEGQIETDKDGRIMVINRQTGKSIDTGLKSGDLTEEQKINLNLKNQKELEGVRQKNRLELEGIKEENRGDERISPSQQRVAEQDAANELLNGKYANFSDNIGFDQSGRLTIKRTGEPETDKILDNFEKEMKALAEGRMNRSVGSRSRTPTTGTTDRIKVIGPNGQTGTVPKGSALPAGWKEVS